MLTNSGSSITSRSNTRNYRCDAVMGSYNRGNGNASNYRYAFAARVSAASGSDGSVGSSQQSYVHQRWARGPPRDQRNADDHRHWIHSNSSPPPSAGRFVVVSLNILGVDNANQHLRELYWHIPPYILDWNYRKIRILKELRLWSPDVICLQEVDRFEDMQTDLVQQGYEGVYKGRTGGSTDGCAIFWRAKKFVLLQEESLEYQEFNLRHNVAQLCVLRTRYDEQNKAKGKRPKGMEDNLVVVCNIHVLFNPNRGDIKLGQVRHLLEKAYSLSQAWGGIPVVVAGDFNSVPQSPLYQFLRDGMLNVTNYDRRAISGQIERSQGSRQIRVERWEPTSQFQVNNEGLRTSRNASVLISGDRLMEDPCVQSFKWSSEELETATGIANESLMKHNLQLESAYSSIQGSQETRSTSNEPLVTTYHGNFMGTVDYIWFTKGLIPLRVLEFLPVPILQRTKGLPSKKWGSDHLALACEFAFTT